MKKIILVSVLFIFCMFLSLFYRNASASIVIPQSVPYEYNGRVYTSVISVLNTYNGYTNHLYCTGDVLATTSNDIRFSYLCNLSFYVRTYDPNGNNVYDHVFEGQGPYSSGGDTYSGFSDDTLFTSIDIVDTDNHEIIRFVRNFGPSAYVDCEPYSQDTNPNPGLPCSYNGYDYDSLAVESGAYVNSFFYKSANYILTDHDWWWSLESQINEPCDGLIFLGDGGTFNCSHNLAFNKSGALFFGVGSSNPSPNLTVMKTGSGSGRVTSDPLGIDCGSICSAKFEKPAVVLTAEADPGSVFIGWSYSGCSPKNNSCIILLNTESPTVIEANFAPLLSPPGAKVIIPEGPIALDKPTVVLTHGLSALSDLNGAPDTLWIGAKAKQAAALIKEETGGTANIFHYIWKNGFQVGWTGSPSENTYNAAQVYVYDAGGNLAKELLKPENLGPAYNGKIHFIGHSLGTIVNAYAARAFLEKATNVKMAQFTALDRPDHVKSNIPGCLVFPGCKGYDENFFGEILQKIQTKPGRGLNLIIDNYYSREGAGVGDKTNGLNVYNHEELINPNDLDDSIFDDEGVDNNHSGVHQWYRWTINPNGLYPGVCDSQINELNDNGLPWNFDETLNPCNKGWKWSIVRANPLPLPTENKPVSTKESILLLADYKDYGCELSTSSIGSIVIQCEEKSSPFGIAEVNIPEDATALSFKYRFTNVGDGDYAAVYLDNIPIWTFAGSSYLGEGEEFVDSGPLPIGDLTGKRALTVILYGVGQKNAQFEMQDIMTLTMSNSRQVVVDIHPGSFPNSINPRSNGVIPVAILTTNAFDATQVDPLSVKFGLGGATESHGRGHIEDANRDGLMDLVLHFATQNSGIQCGDTSASLTGNTFIGQAIVGSDSIQTVGCK